MQTGINDWLLAGDPAIRWQVMRDLLDSPETQWHSEREKVASEGWGAELLSRQDADGRWASGYYSPKWTSTTYTLLLLRRMGLQPQHPQALRGCEHFYFRGLEQDGGINLFKSLDYSETCVNGMLLSLLAYFHHPDERIHSVANFLLGEQMPDGGWNCEKINGASHASFHTTISVLEGLREYTFAYPEKQSQVQTAVENAHEFLLLHRIFKSHRTGKVFDHNMKRMYFPPRWRYDFIRALDYFQSVKAQRDERMDDAINLLLEKQQKNGHWPAYSLWSGRIFFKMETPRQDSRWNTLRALRVLKWWRA